MLNFSFIRYTLTELFRKLDNWRQFYKQTSSTFCTSNQGCLIKWRKNYYYVITRLPNSYIIIYLINCLITTFLKKYRSSHRKCSVRKGVLKNFANFTGKHLCWSHFLWSCRPLACRFFKRRLQHKCFPVKFANLLRTPVLKNISKRLLLEVFYKKDVLKNFAIFTRRK